MSAQDEALPYKVELWTQDKRSVERVLARAANVTLARAILAAAQMEHPERYITLTDLSEKVVASAG
jgi:hypothetical protein